LSHESLQESLLACVSVLLQVGKISMSTFVKLDVVFMPQPLRGRGSYVEFLLSVPWK
jgi:hypothetical protein